MLALAGEHYVGPRWRFEKLGRRFGSTSIEYNKSWNMKAPGDRSPVQYMQDLEEYYAINLGSFHEVEDVVKPLGGLKLATDVRRVRLGSGEWVVRPSAGVLLGEYADIFEDLGASPSLLAWDAEASVLPGHMATKLKKAVELINLGIVRIE